MYLIFSQVSYELSASPVWSERRAGRRSPKPSRECPSCQLSHRAPPGETWQRGDGHQQWVTHISAVKITGSRTGTDYFKWLGNPKFSINRLWLGTKIEYDNSSVTFSLSANGLSLVLRFYTHVQSQFLLFAQLNLEPDNIWPFLFFPQHLYEFPLRESPIHNDLFHFT